MTNSWVVLPVPVANLQQLGEPTINVNPKPAGTITAPEGFDPDAPGAIFDQLPLSDNDVPAATQAAQVIIAPYLYSEELTGRSRHKLVIIEYPYALTTPAVEVEIASRTKIEAMPAKVLAALPGQLSLTAFDAGLNYAKRIAAEAGDFTVTGMGSGTVRDYGIGANVGTFTTTGQSIGMIYQRAPMPLDAGLVAITGQDASFFKGASLAAESGDVGITGNDAGLQVSRVLGAAGGVIAVTGQEAGLSYTSPQLATVLYTGNSGTRTISGLSIQPGLVWIKRRTVSPENHWIFDDVRGTTRAWHSNLVNQQTVSSTSLTAFNSDGFTLGNQSAINSNNVPYVAWCWATGGTATINNSGTIATTCSVNEAVGMSIFTYTGGNGAQTMGHGLGQVPDLIIVKRLDGSSAAFVGSPLIGSGKFLALNSTSGTPTTNSGAFSSITSAVFGGNGVSGFSVAGQSLLGYAFVSIPGISKISTFTGNGGSTQAVTGLGFQPRWVLIKSISGTASDWRIFDDQRDAILFANSTAVETTPKHITFDSNGFTLSSGASVNDNGSTYLFMAFA